jgi:hypothetical protein
MQDMELQSEGVRRRLQFFRCGLGTSGIGRIDERVPDRGEAAKNALVTPP